MKITDENSCESRLGVVTRKSAFHQRVPDLILHSTIYASCVCWFYALRAFYFPLGTLVSPLTKNQYLIRFVMNLSELLSSR